MKSMLQRMKGNNMILVSDNFLISFDLKVFVLLNVKVKCAFGCSGDILDHVRQLFWTQEARFWDHPDLVGRLFWSQEARSWK